MLPYCKVGNVRSSNISFSSCLPAFKNFYFNLEGTGRAFSCLQLIFLATIICKKYAIRSNIFVKSKDTQVRDELEKPNLMNMSSALDDCATTQ